MSTQHLIKCMRLTTALMLLSSCGKAEPENAGAKLGDKRCECMQVGFERELTQRTAVLEALEKDPNLSLDEAQARGRLAADEGQEAEVQARSEQYEQQRQECKKELQTLTNQMLLDFPREEDQQVIRNVIEAKERICEQEQEDREDEIRASIKRLIKERSPGSSVP